MQVDVDIGNSALQTRFSCNDRLKRISTIDCSFWIKGNHRFCLTIRYPLNRR